MLSEIVFVKIGLNAVGYREIFYELYALVTEVQDKKTNFEQDNGH